MTGRHPPAHRPPSPRPPQPTPAAPGSAPAGAGPLLRLAVAVVCGLVGFLLVAQVRATEGIGERLAGEREEDLARILADLTAESDRLQREIVDLELGLADLEDDQRGQLAARESLRERLEDLRILAGTVPVVGEGVVLTVEDPERAVGQDQLVDTVQELRDAGAEAIAVGETRLVASSSFVTSVDGLLLDGAPIAPPYRIAAIGPADALAPALEIPGGAADTLGARPGVRIRIEARDELELPARDEPVTFEVGRPVPTESDG